MTPGRAHPVSLADIEPWRRRTGVDLTEARQRFMQFVVLDCIAISPLGRSLAFKGGNAPRCGSSTPILAPRSTWTFRPSVRSPMMATRSGDCLMTR